MKYFTPLAVASGLIALASAQVYPVPTADDINPATRDIWCVQQREVCPNICLDQGSGDALDNECNVEDLSYVCVCNDGKTPNLTEYSVTIPYNICKWSVQECVNNCKGESACADLCFKGKTCGAFNPTRTNITSTTTTRGPTATSSTTPTGTGSGSKDKFDQSFGLKLEAWGSSYGVAVMVVGVAAGFAGML